MIKTILGSDLAIEQPIRFNYSPTTGSSTTRTWHAAKLSALEAYTPSLIAAGWQYDLQEGKGVHILTATIASPSATGGNQNEVPITTWELLPNRVEKDILESAIATSKVSEDNILLIKAAVESNNSSPAVTGATASAARELYLLLLKGVKSAVIFQPTLHRSQIVSGTYGVQASLNSVGYILSTSTLSNSESIPSTILFTLPNYSNPTVGAGEPTTKYGWLKNYPVVQQVSNNKFQVSQTWEYGLWSTFIYGNPL